MKNRKKNMSKHSYNAGFFRQEPRKKSEKLEISSKVVVKFSDDMLKKIKYTCRKIHEVEWSGIIFYDTPEGKIGVDDVEILVEDFYLLDIGSAAYTEFEAATDSDFIGFLMDNPTYLEKNKGLIHSHNNMSVFFSGTDETELTENADKYAPFYLSVIVNNRHEIVARIGLPGEIKKEKTVVFDNKDYDELELTEKAEDSKVVFHIDCEVDRDEEDIFKGKEEYAERIEELRKNKKAHFVESYTPSSKYYRGGRSRTFHNPYDDDDDVFTNTASSGKKVEDIMGTVLSGFMSTYIHHLLEAKKWSLKTILKNPHSVDDVIFEFRYIAYHETLKKLVKLESKIAPHMQNHMKELLCKAIQDEQLLREHFDFFYNTNLRLCDFSASDIYSYIHKRLNRVNYSSGQSWNAAIKFAIIDAKQKAEKKGSSVINL